MFELLESDFDGLGEIVARSKSGVELWEFETCGCLSWEVVAPDDMAHVTSNFQDASEVYHQWEALYLGV